jgi:hypothetical protein
MAYIGNQVKSNPFIIDRFSGTGSQTQFTGLTFAPAGTAAIAVFVSGVYQDPAAAYTVSGTTLNFTSAPASGTSNIVVLHLGVGATTTVPSDGSVTTIKLADDSVTLDKIANGVLPNEVIKPSITSPANNATGILNNQLFTATTYLSLYGRSQANAQWEISTSPSFAFINVNSTITGSNTQFQANGSSGLTANTVHYIRVRYSDDANNSSDYSNTVQFTTGTFAISVEYLLVAGGGGTAVGSGGGGAGGLLYSSATSVNTGTNYSVTIGGGGTGSTTGGKGSNTVFGSATAEGGGGSSSRPGGSGAGAAWRNTSGSLGTGVPGQGNPGGASPSGFPGGGGGGGGAGATGGAANQNGNGSGGAGGAGLAYSISPPGSTTYAGGGGGGHDYTVPTSTVVSGGTGGAGGGGNGTGGNDTGTNIPGTAGTTNLGGGGGGSGSNFGAGYAGGSGVVLLKYPNTRTISNPGGGLTLSSAPSGSNTVTTITAGTGNVFWS